MGEIFNKEEGFCFKFFETLIIKVPLLFVFLKILFLFLGFEKVAFYPIWVMVSFLAYFCELNDQANFFIPDKEGQSFKETSRLTQGKYFK